MQKFVLYVSFFCNLFTVSLLVLFYVHGLAEFCTIPAFCVYKIKVLFAYSEIQKMQQMILPLLLLIFVLQFLSVLAASPALFPCPIKPHKIKY